MAPVYDVLTTAHTCVYDVLNTLVVYDVLTINTYELKIYIFVPAQKVEAFGLHLVLVLVGDKDPSSHSSSLSNVRFTSTFHAQLKNSL